MTTPKAPSRWPARDRGPTPRKASTRRRLLDAAREAFAEQSIATTSVEEICERAGFTRGAFYSNFADKDALVTELLEQDERQLIERIDTVTQAPIRSIQDMAQALDQFLAARTVDRAFYLIQSELALRAIRERTPAPLFSAAHGGFKERLTVFLERTMDGLGRELTLDADDALELILGIFERSVRRALIDGDEDRLDDLTRSVFTHVIEAISRPRQPSADLAHAGRPD